MRVEEKWYTCPECNKRLLKYRAGAESRELYIKCKRCKEIIEIKINREP